jgi:16S rRNA (guanine527-N7)-methyltransferase
MTPAPDLTELRARLDAGLVRLGLDPTPVERGRLLALIELLARWNRAYNLTAVREPIEMVARHLLDSLSVSTYLHGDRVLDLGTGPGMPGLPLAITQPGRAFVLLDSSGKKTRFVRQAAVELALTNVEVMQVRFESYRPERKFATILSRAVAPLAVIAAAAQPLLEPTGRLLVMKGRRPNDELEALDPVSNRVLVHRLAVPFVEGERHLIEIRPE